MPIAMGHTLIHTHMYIFITICRDVRLRARVLQPYSNNQLGELKQPTIIIERTVSKWTQYHIQNMMRQVCEVTCNASNPRCLVRKRVRQIQQNIIVLQASNPNAKIWVGKLFGAHASMSARGALPSNTSNTLGLIKIARNISQNVSKVQHAFRFGAAFGTMSTLALCNLSFCS